MEKKSQRRHGTGERHPGALIEICEVRDTQHGQELVPLFRQRVAMPEAVQQQWAASSEDERSALVLQFGQDQAEDMWEQLETLLGSRPAARVRISPIVIDDEQLSGPPEMRRLIDGVERWETLPDYDDSSS